MGAWVLVVLLTMVSPDGAIARRLLVSDVSGTFEACTAALAAFDVADMPAETKPAGNTIVAVEAVCAPEDAVRRQQTPAPSPQAPAQSGFIPA